MKRVFLDEKWEKSCFENWKNVSSFQNIKPTRRMFQKEFSSSREIFVPFEKMISLQKLFMASPVLMALSERKAKGHLKWGTVADPKHSTIYQSVSVQSDLWICSQWYLMLNCITCTYKWSYIFDTSIAVHCISSAWHLWDIDHIFLGLVSARVLKALGFCWKWRAGKSLGFRGNLSCKHGGFQD